MKNKLNLKIKKMTPEQQLARRLADHKAIMGTTNMNEIKKIGESKEWKDRAAGYHHWRISIKQCRECGEQNTSYTLWGTRQDAERFASNPEHDNCDKCS